MYTSLPRFVALTTLLILGLPAQAQRPGESSPLSKPTSEVGRFAVVSSGDTIVMVDTATGRSWMLKRTGDAPTWVAIKPSADLTQDSRPNAPSGGPPGPLNRTPSPEEQMKRFLSRFDSNHDGKITRQEFPRFFPAEQFDEMDTNRDGHIDLQEFTKGMQKMRGRFGGFGGFGGPSGGGFGGRRSP